MTRIGPSLVLMLLVVLATPSEAGRDRVRSRSSAPSAVRIDESRMTYSVVHKNADGTLSAECVTGAEAAEQAVAAPPGPPEGGEDASE